MEAVYVVITPFNRATGDRVTVSVADAPGGVFYGLGGTEWQPAIIKRPDFAIELFDPDLSGKVTPGKVDLALSLSAITDVADPQLLYWTGAPITIYTCPDLNWQNRVLEFTGKIEKGDPDKVATTLQISAEVDTSLIDKPLLTLEFDGGGDEGGEPAHRGVLKPAGFGYVENVPPLWFNTTDNIGMLDGYGNVVSIDKLFEGASDMGPAVADYASYAALKAAIVAKVIDRGMWGTCVAEGLIGLGAPPAGVMGCNVHFGADRPGAMMRQIIVTHAGADPAKAPAASFDALDVAVDRETGFWTDKQRNVHDLLAAIAGSCNGTVLVNFQGLVIVTRAVSSAPVATLDYSGSVEPRVVDFNTKEVDPPFYELKARTARPGIVLSDDQVLYEDTLKDQGLYSNTFVYRRGDHVWLSNKANWLYVNATPSAGHAPPDSGDYDIGEGNAWWVRRQFGIGIADIDGLEDDLSQKTQVWVQDTPPDIRTVGINDLWIDTSDNRKTYRVGTERLVINGDYVIIAGDYVVFPGWILNDDQRIGPALDNAMGRVRLFRQEDNPNLYDETGAPLDPSPREPPLIGGDMWARESTGELFVWDITLPGWGVGADITSVNQVVVALGNRNILANYLNVPAPDQFNIRMDPTVTRGGVDIRTDDSVTYALDNVASGLAAGLSVNNTLGDPDKGVVTLTNAYTAPGGFDLVVTVAGVVQPPVHVVITQTNGQPPSGGGGAGGGSKGGSVDLSGNSLSGTALVELARVSGLTVATGETISVFTYAMYYYRKYTGSGSANMSAKAQYSPAGAGSWTDMPAGLIAGDTSYSTGFEYYDPEYAALSHSDAEPGLTAGDYDVRLMVNSSTSSGSINIGSGNFLVEVS